VLDKHELGAYAPRLFTIGAHLWQRLWNIAFRVGSCLMRLAFASFMI